ncbi:hypothetical protein DY000_02021637 [Brassica cretica]|uniref:Peptidase A2 domain-containing protein n=1 Tax=Brassica cretica TaxID=69181 RepID=A0ABQ7E6X2_BRACR|nr:hypothetical protein DY000_02021637 [Brassica cretica]
MFHQVREKMRQKITLKKKSDPGKFVIPCLIGGIDYPSALCDTGSSVSILPMVTPIKMKQEQLDDLLDPTRPFGELDGALSPTRPFGELDGVFGLTRPFGEMDDMALWLFCCLGSVCPRPGVTFLEDLSYIFQEFSDIDSVEPILTPTGSICLRMLTNSGFEAGEVGDVLPCGHCHPFGFLQGPVLVPSPVLASCLLSRLLIVFLFSIISIISGPASAGPWIDSRHLLPILLVLGS